MLTIEQHEEIDKLEDLAYERGRAEREKEILDIITDRIGVCCYEVKTGNLCIACEDLEELKSKINTRQTKTLAKGNVGLEASIIQRVRNSSPSADTRKGEEKK